MKVSGAEFDFFHLDLKLLVKNELVQSVKPISQIGILARPFLFL